MVPTRPRPTLKASVAIAFALVLAGCVSSGSATTSTPPTRGSTTSTTGPSSTSTPASCPNYVEGLSFVNTKDGFAMFRLCTQTSSAGAEYQLVQTTDGGVSWGRVVAGLAFGVPSSDTVAIAGGSANHLSFVSSAYGVAYMGDEVSVTNNGGVRWRRLTAPGPVVDAFSSEGEPWILVLGSCGSGHCLTVAFPVLPHRLGAARPIPDGSVEIVAVGSTWFSAPVAHTFLVSRNGGRSWRRHSFPMRCLTPTSDFVAATNQNVVWVACAVQLSAGAEAKAIFRSEDGGRTWTETAQAAAFNVTTAIGHLRATGYVCGLATASVEDALLCVTGPAGWMESSPDGGVDWTVTNAPRDGGSPTFGVECVRRVCWTSGPGTVYRSSDGGLRWDGSEVDRIYLRT